MNPIDFILHIDKHLMELAAQYGQWIYAILFAIVFAETGLVVMPLLPGDSLLFAAGALAARDEAAIDPVLCGVVVALAAFCGDNVNYWIGRHLGPKVFSQEDSLFFRRSHLEKTEAFYNRYGTRTVILARFIPIVRTFAPFVAGVGKMDYRIYILFSCIGSALWVPLCIGAGYWFGNIPVVQKNFSLVILGVIFLSVLPMMIEFLRHKFGRAGVA